VSVVYRDLASGREALIGPEVSYHPASTFKLCVMVEVYRQAANGTLRLDEPLPVRNEFKSISDGSPYTLSAADDADADLYKHVGESLPVRELVDRMITRSSNLATNLLIDRVTAASVTGTMKSLGATGLVVLRGVEDGPAYARGMNNAATAKGLARILELLARRKVISPAASDEMIAILKRQQHNEGIPAGVPSGVAVAHKTGWIEKLYHDAAIVYPPGRKPYVLVVMTRGLEENHAAPKLVSEISRLVYDAAVR
jgi:beta-lactamase class A